MSNPDTRERTRGRPSQDEIWQALANPRRRAILDYLSVTAPPVEIGDLAEYVAAVENECPQEDVSWDQRKRVYIGLQQGHLPNQLDPAGIIDFDSDRGTIRRGEHFDAAVSALWNVREACEDELDAIDEAAAPPEVCDE